MSDDDLEILQKKLDGLKKQKENVSKEEGEKQEDSDNMRMGLRAGSELVAAVLAGGFIGYWLDDFFGTKPLFLLALLVLGIITGFINVWRVSEGIGTSVGIGKSVALKRQKDDDKEQ